MSLVLGDSSFYDNGLSRHRTHAVRNVELGCVTAFGYHVDDSERFGAVELYREGRVASVGEKPAALKSSRAVAGLYISPVMWSQRRIG